jgi:hypothetical protein
MLPHAPCITLSQWEIKDKEKIINFKHEACGTETSRLVKGADRKT